jgi:predicted DNA-binding transcriptional regulator AlpA
MKPSEKKVKRTIKIPSRVPKKNRGTFLGINKESDSVEILIQGIKTVGQGSLYREKLPRTEPPSPKEMPYLREKIYTSRNFHLVHGVSRYIYCQNKEKDELFVFFGKLDIASKARLSNEKLTALKSEKTNLRPRCDSHRSAKVKAGKMEKRQAELAAIGAAFRAGLDPDVKLNDVEVLVHWKKSSIYQKIKLGLFPAPHKRGNSSFWRMSEIDAYLAGDWQLLEE